jgi:hypothetical protein
LFHSKLVSPIFFFENKINKSDSQKWSKVMSRKMMTRWWKEKRFTRRKYNHCLAKLKRGLLERNKNKNWTFKKYYYYHYFQRFHFLVLPTCTTKKWSPFLILEKKSILSCKKWKLKNIYYFQGVHF